MDQYLREGIDWLYAPMETYIPVSRCPVAVTLHDIQAFEPNLPWSHTWQHRWFSYKWGQWVRKALRDCRIIFTVSYFSKQRMVKLLGANPQKIVVVGNGVEQGFFNIAKIDPLTLASSVQQPYILVIGGLRMRNGADYVLAVAKELQHTKSKLQIVIVGDSEPKYILATQDSPNIKLLGSVSDQDLPRLVRCASSLLFLSLYEGFGIPALEAMAAGVPAVVSHCASLPEVVGDAGIVVDPSHTGAIVEVLENLLNDNQLRQSYIDRGYQHVSHYTWENCVNKVIQAFEQFS